MPEPFIVDAVFAQQFASNFKFVAQQQRSVLESAVTRETGIVGMSKSIDFATTRTAKLRTNRIQETPINPQAYIRRWLDLAPWDDGDIVTDPEKIRLLTDPQSTVVQAMTMGLNRAKDKVIVEAMLGSSRGTDENGASYMIALPNTQKIVHGGTGLTKAKMVAALSLFTKNEVKREYGADLYCALSAYQLQDLMNDDSLMNTEFNTVFNMYNGTVNTGRLFGFQILSYENAPTFVDGGNTIQRVPFWDKAGVVLGTGEDIQTQVGQDPSMSFDTRVYGKMDLGAVRGEEVRVMEVQCVAA